MLQPNSIPHPSSSDSPPSLGETLLILRRHLKLGVGVFSAILLMAVAFVLLCPRKYKSEARLFVRVGHEASTLDPTATTGHVITVQRSPHRDLNSVRQILRSQPVLEHVVDTLGTDAILGKSDASPSLIARIRGTLPKLRLDPVADREQAIRTLKDRLSVEIAEDADIVQLTYKSKSPTDAQQMLGQVIEGFFEVHRNVRRIAGSHDFFIAQTDSAKRELDQARERLRLLKQQWGIVSIDSKRSLLNDRLTQVGRELARVDQERAGARSKTKYLRESIAALPATVVQETVDGVGNQATDQMRAQLYDLQITEEQLRAKLKPDHPSLVAVQKQREKVERILQQQPISRTQATTAINPVTTQLQLDLLTEQALLARLTAEADNLSSQHATLQTEIAELTEREIQISELEDDIERLRGLFQLYSKKQEEARLSAQLDEDHISSINVLQPPTLWEKPVLPRVLPTLLVGIFLACVCTVLAVIAAEYFDHSLVIPQQIETQLGIPVLAAIPRVISPTDDSNAFASTSQETQATANPRERVSS